MGQFFGLNNNDYCDFIIRHLNGEKYEEIKKAIEGSICWHQKIGEPTLADAICDRIVHDSYTIVIGGTDSMRKRKGITEEA